MSSLFSFLGSCRKVAGEIWDFLPKVNLKLRHTLLGEEFNTYILYKEAKLDKFLKFVVIFSNEFYTPNNKSHCIRARFGYQFSTKSPIYQYYVKLRKSRARSYCPMVPWSMVAFSLRCV